MGHYGPFRALRCQFLDERERTEARSVDTCGQMIPVVASAQTDRHRSGVRSRQPTASGEPGSYALLREPKMTMPVWKSDG